MTATERSEHGVGSVNHSIRIAAILGFVVLSKSNETIGLFRGRLWSEAAEQLRAIVYSSVAVPVQHQERVIGARGRPRHTLSHFDSLDIKVNAAGCVC